MTAANTKGLHVSSLLLRDFMRFDELEVITQGKSLILIKGPNETGKTTIERAVQAVLCGAQFDPEKPIRDGQKSAAIELHLREGLKDKYKAHVTWTENGRRLTLSAILDDGNAADIKKPQTALAAMVGDLSFDPLKLTKLPANQQAEEITKAIGTHGEYVALAGEIKTATEARRDKKRAAAEARAQLGTPPDPERKVNRVDVATLAERIRDNNTITAAISAHDRDYEAARSAAATAHRRALELQTEMTERVRQYEAAIIQAHTLHNTEVEKSLTHKHAADELRTRRTATADLETQLAQVQAANAVADAQARYETNLHALDQKDAAVAALEQQIDELRQRTLKLAAHPAVAAHVGQIALEPDGSVTFEGIPLSQHGKSLQLKLSATIAMLANPTVRVMCIDEGDCLDPQSIAELTTLAEEHNYQIWMSAVWCNPTNAQIVNLDIAAQNDGSPNASPQSATTEQPAGSPATPFAL